MKADQLLPMLTCDFFSGVPDSQLKPLCDSLMATYGVSEKHIIAANEGNAAALAAGYYLATGKTPVVYLQNSGIGHIVNPLASLLNERVYGIPCLFIVGWRGEPGVRDEPQHIYQGMVTKTLLEDMELETFEIAKDTTEDALRQQLEAWKPRFAAGRSAALIVHKGALEAQGVMDYRNDHTMRREAIIRRVVEAAGTDVIVSTTGKASRELFEIREANGQPHCYDFLTVGSMGHSSSIALGVALYKPHTRVWCIDGDGAALMHMGAMAVIGANRPANLIHLVVNNAAHETVGGMPTVAGTTDLVAVAKACGYPSALSVSDDEGLQAALATAKGGHCLSFIEVKAAIGSRADLGRPTTTAMENRKAFMAYLAERD